MIRSLLGLLLLAPLMAFAQDAPVDAPNGAVTDTQRIQAPSQNVDGTPLTDLSHITLFVGIGQTDSADQSFELSVTDPGSTADHPIELTLQGSHGAVITVNYWATATDGAGNMSERSNIVTKAYRIVDDTAPQAPIILTQDIVLHCRTPEGEVCGLEQVAAL